MCGNFSCSKNTLVGINVVYVVSKYLKYLQKVKQLIDFAILGTVRTMTCYIINYVKNGQTFMYDVIYFKNYFDSVLKNRFLHITSKEQQCIHLSISNKAQVLSINLSFMSKYLLSRSKLFKLPYHKVLIK